MAGSVQTDAQAVQSAIDDLDNLATSSYGGAEGLDGSSCSPFVTHLAKIAIGAAARGCSHEGWRTEVAKARGPEAARQLDEAEECMRHCGLWPWA